MRIGVIGCGMVSHAYCGTIARTAHLELVALASRTMASAEMSAAQYGGQAMPVDALLASTAIDLVVVLAPPALHYPIGRRVLEAGKHLYLEKPLATSLDDAAALLDLAAARGLQVGCAPDTLLSAGHQRARRLIDAGTIGTVTGGAAAFGTRGMELWHPAPALFYAAGGGPLLDVGPYHLSQLVDLLGPVAEVCALGTAPRTIRAGLDGAAIPVSVSTSVAGALRFVSGALVSLALSWDIPAHGRAPLELYGDGGVMVAPDPNGFDGATRLSVDGRTWQTHGPDKPAASPSPERLAAAVARLMAGTDSLTGGAVDAETPLRFGDRRGLGVIDMAAAIRSGRAARAGGALAFTCWRRCWLWSARWRAPVRSRSHRASNARQRCRSTGRDHHDRHRNPARLGDRAIRSPDPHPGGSVARHLRLPACRRGRMVGQGRLQPRRRGA
ncbi:MULTISPECIES: Gfo/Idh/MocA family oxidoreductase [unclassified Sphingomonas]|uniref:Gfo/Idh/MocA family protein n=1 Tax=unclassified Sphingomonas TaxID=196159 RepID=UPI0022698C11|nr:MULTISPECIES: Gfo/Idh/MocA family oxidoreductase [unclassified Sphingomonas]